jgi:hypothetical protein
MFRLCSTGIWSTPSERRGSLLIDALLAVVIFGSVVAAFSTGIFEGSEGSSRAGNRVRAVYLAQEGLEAVRTIRDDDDDLDPDDGFALIDGLNKAQTHGIQLSGSTWGFSGTETVIDGKFTRQIGLAQGADSDELIVTSTVAWTDSDGQPASLVLRTSFSDWRTDPPPPPPDWTNPSVKWSYQGFEENDFVAIAVDDTYAYVTGNNGEGFYVYDISDIDNVLPFYVTSIAINSWTGMPAVVKQGGYAYVARSINVGELSVLDLSGLPASVSETPASPIDPSGWGVGLDTTLDGTTLYLARSEENPSDEFVEYDIGADPATPSEIASHDFAGSEGRRLSSVALHNDYVYMGTNKSDAELTAIDSTGAPAVSGGSDIAGTGAEGLSTAVFSDASNDVLYMGTRRIVDGENQYQLFSFDISGAGAGNPGAHNDQYDTGGDNNSDNGSVLDMAVSSNPPVLFLASTAKVGGTPDSLQYFQAIDISSPLVIDGKRMESLDMYTHVGGGGLDESPGATGIAFRPSDHTVFVVGGAYFVVIQPAPGSYD